MVLMQSMLSAEQRKLGINEGQQPGAELLAAVEAANEAGCELNWSTATFRPPSVGPGSE